METRVVQLINQLITKKFNPLISTRSIIS